MVTFAYDARKNAAVSSVLTAPSPAASGVTLVVASGEGARFPAAPFNATILPVNTIATPSNMEVVRVTNRTTDTLTIVRSQEGSSARTIVAGDIIYAGFTDKALSDLETILTTYLQPWANTTAPSGALVGTTDTQTLTAKRVPPRQVSVTSSATPALNTDNADVAEISSLATNVTSFTSSLTGTPLACEFLTYRVKDSGSTRTLAWGASFISQGGVLPLNTTPSKWHTMVFMWDASVSKWACLSATVEP